MTRILEFGVAATHRVDVTDALEAAVASLACHREYLAAISDDPVEQQAESIIHSSLLWEDGRAHLGFRVYG